jgi:Mn-dependent DtxR family transcriptional regulator
MIWGNLMDEVEIRRKILKNMYDLDNITQGYSVDSRDLMERLDVTSEELFSNVKYLEKDGYLELEKFLGDEFKAKITTQGIKKVEKMGY